MARHAIVFVLLLAACSSDPKRPAGVPTAATWAGGADGGAWVQCDQTTKEPYAAFDCTTYYDGGSLWARGHYIHATHRPTGYVPVGDPFPRIKPESYDGRVIYLTRGTALVPDGWVEYPVERAHEKRMEFRLGKEVSPEISY